MKADILTREKTHKKSSEWHLVVGTYLVGFSTLLLAGFGMWQVCLTRNALSDQQISNEKQIARMDSQLINSQKSENRQRGFDSVELSNFASQLQVSRESMYKQLRAYLTVAPFRPVMDSSGILPFEVTVKNEGETPAYDLRIWVCVNVGTEDLITFVKRAPVNMIWHVPELAKNVSGAPITSSFLTNEYKLTNFLRTKLLQGDYSLFYWGEVKFKDAFGRQHSVIFRFKNNWDSTINDFGPSIFGSTEGNSTY